MELNMKKISILGDSISTFQGYTPPGGVYYAPSFGTVSGIDSVEDSWFMKVIHRRNGILLRNNSWAGSTVAASGMMGACSLSRIRGLSTDEEVPDLILVYTGLNDVNFYLSPEVFGSDYLIMLSRIRTAYPQAHIYCGTLIMGYLGTPSLRRIACTTERLLPYNDCIRSAVNQPFCHLADLAKTGKSYSSIDGFHPDRKGMDELAELFLSAMPPLSP